MRSTPEFAYLRRGLGQDTCAGTESTVSGSGPETFSSEPEPTQGGIGFLGKLLLRSQRSVDTRSRPQPAGPGPDRKLKPSLDCLDE